MELNFEKMDNLVWALLFCVAGATIRIVYGFWQNSFGVITLFFKLGSLSKCSLFSVSKTSQHSKRKEAAIAMSWYSIGCPFEIRYAFNSATSLAVSPFNGTQRN